jgi:hypothetical protein
MNERVDVPVSARHCFDQTCATLCPAAKPTGATLRASFIHENQPLGIDLHLACAPDRAL